MVLTNKLNEESQLDIDDRVILKQIQANELNYARELEEKLSNFAIEIRETNLFQLSELDSRLQINFESPIDPLVLICAVVLRTSKIHPENALLAVYHPTSKYSSSLNNLLYTASLIPTGTWWLKHSYADLFNSVNREYLNGVSLTNDFISRTNFDYDSVVGIVIDDARLPVVHKHQVVLYVSRHELMVAYNNKHELIIRGLERSLKHLLSRHSDNLSLNQNAAQVSSLDDASKLQILYQWNQNDRAFPQEKTLHQLFEEQAKRTPEKTALVYQSIKLSYQELNAKSNQLANYLRDSFAIKADDLVGLYLDRSEYMLIAILGVLKSGGAYVPIDPTFPNDRVSYILSEIKSKVLIINEKYSHKLKLLLDSVARIDVAEQNLSGQTFESMPLIELDAITVQIKLNQLADANLAHPMSSRNLSYVIFTSGTTGKPKGVQIEHRGVVNLAFGLTKKLGLKTRINDEITQCNSLLYTNYVFDVHVLEIFPFLINGHCLHLIAGDERYSLELLAKYIERNNIAIAFLPPALLNAETLLQLEKLILGGEKAANSIMELYAQNGVAVFNAYGPTEISVCATIKRYKRGDLNTNIGQPIMNVKTYILDKFLNPMDVGVIGELYIGGVGLARGYLNQPQLTAEKFILDPAQSASESAQNENSRLYKTGDLARYLEDGNIEFIGRSDFQVKLNGFRIELGEIESIITSYPNVQAAVVLINSIKLSGGDSPNKYLGAYYLATTTIDSQQLLNYMQNYLPKYMLPSTLIQIDKFPLTINGKIDVKSLQRESGLASTTYVAPGDYLERQLSQLWGGVFNLIPTQVGIETSFFALGGNSLLATKLVSQINSNLKVKLSFSIIYKCSTIKSLASYLRLSTNDSLVSLINPTPDYSKPMLILFHTAIGGSEVYFNFAALLLNDFDIYLVDSYNLSQGDKDNFIFELPNLTKHYADRLANYLPKYSCYLIGGWSFGGILAASFMNLLSPDKQKKAELFLFDTYTPDYLNQFLAKNHIQNKMDTSLQKETRHVHDMMYRKYNVLESNGNSSNRDLVPITYPDYGEYLGMQQLVKIYEKINRIYSKIEIILIHEGHLHSDVNLFGSDIDVAEYIKILRDIIKPYSFIQSYALNDLVSVGDFEQQRNTFVEKYCPNEDDVRHLITDGEKLNALYKSYSRYYLNTHVEDLKLEQNTRAKLRSYAKERSLLHLRKYLGAANLVKQYFNGVPYIRLSQVYKEPKITDQITINTLEGNHCLGTSGFYTVVKHKDNSFSYCRRIDSILSGYKLSTINGLFLYEEV